MTRESYVFERFTTAYSLAVSERLVKEYPCVANNLRAQHFWDHTMQSVVLQFRSFLLKMSERGLDTVEFEIPATWWQMFKEAHFPRWMKHRFPVVFVTQEHKYEKYTRLCPHADIAWSDDCRPHVEFMEGSNMGSPAAIEVAQDSGLKVLHTVNLTDTMDNPVGELRSTVRLGRKWLDAEPGERVLLTLGRNNHDRHPFGEAVIERIEYLPFDTLTQRHIETNHNTLSRDRLHLVMDAMYRAYGDKFSADSPVTVIFYRRISQASQ